MCKPMFFSDDLSCGDDFHLPVCCVVPVGDDALRIIIVREHVEAGFDTPCLCALYAGKLGGLLDYLGFADQLKKVLAICYRASTGPAK